MTAQPNLALVPQETDALAHEALALVDRASALTISDEASYRNVAEFGLAVKTMRKKIADFFKPHKERAHAAWRGLCTEEAKQLAPCDTAEATIKRKMLEFEAAERRRKEDERRRAEEAARKLEEDRRIQTAIEAEAAGDIEEADAILEAPVVAPPPPRVLETVTKVEGVKYVSRWTFDAEEIRIEALIAHIAGVETLAHPELVALLAPNTTSIRSMVTALKSGFNVPGIKAYETKTAAFGGR